MLSHEQGWIRSEKLSLLFSLYVRGNRDHIEMQIHNMNFMQNR